MFSLRRSFLQLGRHAHFNLKSRYPSFNFRRTYSAYSEVDAVKKALEEDSHRKKLADPNGQIQQEKRMLIGFTCKKCQARTHRTMSHHAYYNGIVLIECSGCQSRHLIADNLGWFKDTPQAARRIDQMDDIGSIRRSLNLNEEESKGLIELLKDD